MRRFLARLSIVAALAALVMLATAPAAFADVSVDEPTAVFPVTIGALLAWGISSVVIPYLTAFTVDLEAPDWVSTLIANGLAGLAAVAAYFADVPGIPDWKYAVGLFASILVGSLTFRKQVDRVHTERDDQRSLYRRGLHVGRPRAA